MSNKTVRMLISISMNLLVIVLGVYIVFSVGTKAYNFGVKVFNEQAYEKSGDGRNIEVTIAKGISADKLSTILYDKGLVEDRLVAFCQIQFSDYKGKFIEGTYTLNTRMTPSQMMIIMTGGNSEEEEE